MSFVVYQIGGIGQEEQRRLLSFMTKSSSLRIYATLFSCISFVSLEDMSVMVWTTFDALLPQGASTLKAGMAEQWNGGKSPQILKGTVSCYF